MFQLRDYQDDISTRMCEILKTYKLGYIAMEVRTGKTFCAFATCEKFGAKHVNFITKKKAIKSIENDYAEMNPSFTLEVLNFESIVKFKRVVAETLEEESKKKKREWTPNFKVLKPSIWVVDEADSLGQFPKPSERTEILIQLAEGDIILFLSGTPHPETPSQLYHQLKVSSFSPWKEHKTFYAWVRAGYVKLKKRFIKNREHNDYTEANHQRIAEETAHLFITYSQEEAGFKQKVQEFIHYIKMKPSTYNLANTIVKKRVYVGANGEEIVADTAVKVQNKLHQIFSGTVKLEPQLEDQPDGTQRLAAPKTMKFDDSKVKYILEKFAGKKLVIFYKFIAEGEMLKAAFEGRWTDSPELFNERADLMFICQISSGKQGVNVSTADLQIMFNPDFSANSYWQGRARQITKDRDRPVIVIWLLAENGIEQKIYESVMNKKDYTLQYFKRDFMPWLLKKEAVLLTAKQQEIELTIAEQKAIPPPPSPIAEPPQRINNNFEDPFN